ncbi:hypothetical protein BTS2_0379 [Bacillus sp. TS-2]|nr:hypothetical protein BTS2_0379 [Bacillus sp. TS-2]
MKAQKVRIQNYYEQIGVEKSPQISWIYSDIDVGKWQKAYHIILSSSDGNRIYDTGEVQDNNQNYIELPVDLMTHKKYCVQVGIVDNEGIKEWSDIHSFVSGIADGEILKPDWITGNTMNPVYFGKSFVIEEAVEEAYVSICGLGQFEGYMNGIKIGDHELDGPWTDYNKEILYTTFDISNQIKEGKNDILLEVANGWYIGKTNDDRHFYTSKLGYEPYGSSLLAYVYMTLRMASGEEKTIFSDGTWWVEKSSTLLANIYGSEDYDARNAKSFSEHFNMEHTRFAQTIPFRQACPGILKSAAHPPVKVKKIYDTIEITEPQPNVFLFDLGQNMSGQFEIKVRGQRGAKIRVTPVEKIDENGNIKKTTETWCNYILKGNPNGEFWKPKFSYIGARWVQIEWATRDPKNVTKPFIEDVKGYFITSSAEDVGKFATSDSRYGKIHDLVKKAIESNLNHVHTDCPTIEKLGWLEPNHLMGPSVMYMKNVDTLWNKISDDMRASQYGLDEYDVDHANVPFEYGAGLIPSIAPRYGKFLLDGGMGSFWDIIPWGSSILLAAEMQQQFYGNEKIVQNNYETAKNYVNYQIDKYQNYNDIYSQSGEARFICHGLGDWGIEQNKGESRENIETAFLYKDVTVLVGWAKQLEKESDVEYYQRFADEILENYNHFLLKETEDGNFYYQAFDANELKVTQVNQAIPLFFDMVPKKARKSVEASFINACQDKRIRSGEVGLRFVFRMLSELNRNDIVDEMIMQKEHPSYYRFIERGETTLPEFWRDDARSRNHDMMGQVIEWFYSSVAGITSNDGFKTIQIRPDFVSKLKSIDCNYQSISGNIEVSVSTSEDKVTVKVETPVNTKAWIDLSRLGVSENINLNNEVFRYTSPLFLKGGRHKISFKKE